MTKRLQLLAGLLLLTLAVTAQNTQEHHKLSPYLEALAHQTKADGLRRAPAAKTATIDVLCKLVDGADEAVLAARYGFEVSSRIGRILVLRMPLGNVTAMAEDDQVLRLEAERNPRPLLDKVPGQIGADKAWDGSSNQLPQAYTGKGVVVGIVDAGFDYIHPFFRDQAGNTRITWATDYVADKKYTTTADVTAAMHSSDAATMYHGTHVAGIAAGSRVEDADWDQPTAYQGIASEADIAEGAISADVTSEGLSSATTVKAFSDIFDYAKQQGKPCVINYSMGEAMTFSNSRQLEEESLSELLKTPGRALVVAAGNSGSTCRLAHKTSEMTEGGVGVVFNDWEQYGTYFGIEVKVKAGQTVRLRRTNSNYLVTNGEKSLTVDELSTTSTFLMGFKIVNVTAKGETADGYKVFYLGSDNSTFETSERILVTIQGEGEAWIYADALCAGLENVPSVANHSLAENGYSVAWPAMLSDVITVGNIAHRFKILTLANKYAGGSTMTDLTAYESTKGEGYLAKSSSVGPTLTGGMKPDVCAPGVNIVSAMNYFINDDVYYDVASWDIAALDTEYETWGTLSGYFHIMAQTGTSMSAPAVTGTIALWMQADPTLTTERIKDIIAHSSRQPDSELTYPNNQYGHGEIDAYKGLLYMLGLTGIREISTHQPQQTRIQLSGRQLTVTFADGYQGEASIRIFSTDGRLLLQTSETCISLDTLPQGVYAVQVTTGQRTTTGSTLIRL